MAPRYRNIAVIGSGPCGIATVRALVAENIFDTIQVFERREKVGGTWIYDEIPTPFLFTDSGAREIPDNLPISLPPAPEDTLARTSIYYALDSDVGAEIMSFSHTPIPLVNSAVSVQRYGSPNPTRPFRTVASYLEDIAGPYSHLISLNTTVERVEKLGELWTLTLRRTDHCSHVDKKDYWWQAKFDAVVVATGHYNVPYVPEIPGLREAFEQLPGCFEHAKAFRSPDKYVGKKVVLVGGSVSAADVTSHIHDVTSSPLYLSQRGTNEVLSSAWNLPNVLIKPEIKAISVNPNNKINVEFIKGSPVADIDIIHFATGYKISYPFLVPDPVTSAGRVGGFYQHVFNIADPSLTMVGQVKAGISFRVYEHQAVAVARFFAGIGGDLPPQREQEEWEMKRLEYKGPSSAFHTIRPDYAEYYDFLKRVAGAGADGHELPAWKDEWKEVALSISKLKDIYWKEVRERHDQKERMLRGKL